MCSKIKLRETSLSVESDGIPTIFLNKLRHIFTDLSERLILKC